MPSPRTSRGHPVRRGRVDGRAVEGALAENAERHLIGDRLADQRRARFQQCFDGPGVAVGRGIRARPVRVAAAGRQAGHIEQVLGREGQPFERPAGAALDPDLAARNEGTVCACHLFPLDELVEDAVAVGRMDEHHAARLDEPRAVRRHLVPRGLKVLDGERHEMEPLAVLFEAPRNRALAQRLGKLDEAPGIAERQDRAPEPRCGSSSGGASAFSPSLPS